jgi:hypothetical protein
VSESNNFQKRALTCVRIAAECKGLASNAPSPGLRAHFLRMAFAWAELADQFGVGRPDES